MEWFSAPDQWLARWLVERGLGVIYLLAFLAVLDQFQPLLGERGLLPVPRFLSTVRFREAPSLFHLHFSDLAVTVFAWIGVAIALSIIIGLPQAGPLWLPMLAWFVLWILYVSIVNVGQAFYAFGWESLLLEAGFLAIFLGNAATSPPLLVLLLFRWLAFRVEFGAGLIKLRGDPCWRDLSCLDYHHETQPMPNPFSWYFHRLPPGLHRVEVLGNHFAQLVVPFGLFMPQPIAGFAALVIIATQAYLVLSGNYAWLNVITITIAFAALPDDLLRMLLPIGEPSLVGPSNWYIAAVLGLTALVLALSYLPVRNMLGRRQLMNFSFNPLHIVNTYGAFGSVTRERYEIVVEGSPEEQPSEGSWQAYEFRGKPGDPMRRPPQVAPYHLRLDWLMWFAALSPSYAQRWFPAFLEKLLSHDPATRSLLRRDPFPDRPPVWIRARLYLYRFTTSAERRETGAWWSRELVDEYMPAVRLERQTA
jgi:hypothetical protein